MPSRLALEHQERLRALSAALAAYDQAPKITLDEMLIAARAVPALADHWLASSRVLAAARDLRTES
jgi:hypothetical protein